MAKRTHGYFFCFLVLVLVLVLLWTLQLWVNPPQRRLAVNLVEWWQRPWPGSSLALQA